MSKIIYDDFLIKFPSKYIFIYVIPCRLEMSYIGLPRTFARTPLTSYVFWGVVGVGVVLAGNEIDQNERDRTSR